MPVRPQKVRLFRGERFTPHLNMITKYFIYVALRLNVQVPKFQFGNATVIETMTSSRLFLELELSELMRYKAGTL